MTAAAMPGYTPYLVAAAIAFAMYRRIRGNFGRQPWRPKRTIARVALLSAVLGMLALAAGFAPARAWGVGPGALVGLALGLLSLRLLRIEVIDGQRGYTPNPWIGLALTAVLLGRLASRYAAGDVAHPQALGPLTMAIAAALVSCYLVQGIGLLLRMRRLPMVPQPVAG
ncbi:MAG TPA: hypothetical protein VIG54_06945 [Lysobacter sp.]